MTKEEVIGNMNTLLVLILAFALHIGATANGRTFTAEGPSMEPTIHAEQKLNVSTTYYKEHPVERGDIIVFNATKERMYIKRVIALPGETVRVDGDNIYINGKLIEEPYLSGAVETAHAQNRTWNVRNYTEKTVPEGSYFVLGDNRSNSADSRDIGFIKIENIVGIVTSISGKSIHP
jgi:signal peptidase I